MTIHWFRIGHSLTFIYAQVAQLVGYIGEKTAYHHGEQSLTSSIVGLAQDFVGANNVNLLSPDGQYGSRWSVSSVGL